MLNVEYITNKIKNIIFSSGFDLVGISEAQRLEDYAHLEKWIEYGYQGDMKYMENVSKRSDVREIDGSFKSVISCAINYNSINNEVSSSKAEEQKLGWISRYATGDDYHYIIKKKLKSISHKIEDLFEFKPQIRYYVDTGPVLERAHAGISGVGWIGKNSCLINKDIGSWIFLSEILIDQVLQYDCDVKDMCGTCTKCIDSCPTNAIVMDKVIDSNKCISYLNIENKKYISDDLAKRFANNIYGCDICQEVCPWNKKAKLTNLKIFSPRPKFRTPDLVTLLSDVEKNWETLKIKSPIKRVKKEGMIRNILIVMGNTGDANYIPILERYLVSKDKIYVRTARDSIQRIQNTIGS